ncbi:chromophore lyase CpcT/CpeT [Aquimarina sp. U1-2]|uniref:chromophore lyase CpcT/CpeT n=1 Tax=Aquimarina sp. U1-2 TaxID=2823141 RepID=UPI001AECE0D0|nr:chromophore lyase CpcT/CpeT [Aquimarina sp. U1-2]MBP2830911.1 chromophore lyase CpcT/CpeT [Aquimarina sp. U1-2]
MNRLLLFLILFVLFSGCTTEKAKDVELNNLVSLLIGNFSNAEQAKDDPSFAHLSLINVQIWEERPGIWIYSKISDIEQNYIYSERIVNYNTIDSTKFSSTSYTIPKKKNYQYDWEDVTTFDAIPFKELNKRDGCDMYFSKKTSTIYSGKIKKGVCMSRLEGVHYLTSSLVLSKDKISIWTKGYDEKGKQVWGKIKGPYKYKRITETSSL